MPHLILECSHNIIQSTSFDNLFHTLHNYLAEKLSTDIGNCKSRIISHTNLLIGAGETVHAQAFVHLTVKIRPGRTTEVRALVGHGTYQILKDYIHHSNLNCDAISVELIELSDCYFK